MLARTFGTGVAPQSVKRYAYSCQTLKPSAFYPSIVLLELDRKEQVVDRRTRVTLMHVPHCRGREPRFALRSLHVYLETRISTACQPLWCSAFAVLLCRVRHARGGEAACITSRDSARATLASGSRLGQNLRNVVGISLGEATSAMTASPRTPWKYLTVSYARYNILRRAFRMASVTVAMGTWCMYGSID